MMTFEQAATSYAVSQGLKLRMQECMQRGLNCAEYNIDHSYWDKEYQDTKDAVEALFGEATAARFAEEVRCECSTDARQA